MPLKLTNYVVFVGASEVLQVQSLADRVRAPHESAVQSQYLRVRPVESPATKWPSIFADVPIFVQYPYLLPCAVASSVTFTGKYDYRDVSSSLCHIIL